LVVDVVKSSKILFLVHGRNSSAARLVGDNLKRSCLELGKLKVSRWNQMDPVTTRSVSRQVVGTLIAPPCPMAGNA
jgi:hypothetical protein